MTLVRVTSGLLYSPLSGRHVIANAPIVGYISREENILKISAGDAHREVTTFHTSMLNTFC